MAFIQAGAFTMGNTLDGFAYDLAPAVGFDPAFTAGDEPSTSPAGYFAANGYGLYDMAANGVEGRLSFF